MKLEVPIDSDFTDHNSRDLWIVTLRDYYRNFKIAYYAYEGKYAVEYAKREYGGYSVISWQLASEVYKWRKS